MYCKLAEEGLSRSHPCPSQKEKKESATMKKSFLKTKNGQYFTIMGYDVALSNLACALPFPNPLGITWQKAKALLKERLGIWQCHLVREERAI